jgi:anti-anti-sigma factor
MSVGTVAFFSGDGAWPLARITGAVDLSNVEELGRQVEQSVSNRARGLVLDLSGVTYLDSTGLRLIYRLARQLGDRQQRLRLVVPETSRIRRVLTLAGVGTVAQVVQNPSQLDHAEEDNP